ncbi:MAG TPA: hypothetical protein VFV54_09215 [Thermoanaerobaculia bacterium]|nr:hypothetical protein [Thermoanaerobaculia bacterium]
MIRSHRALIIGLALLVLALSSALAVESQPATPSFLFVQNAGSGELIPVAGRPADFELVLRGVSPATIYFSDRPERIVGQLPTADFLARIGFPDDNPPNAALDLVEGEAADVLVVELRNPRYDASAGELRYSVQLLETAKGGLAEFNGRVSRTAPQRFERASLFIDDCADAKVYCYKRGGSSKVSMGSIRVGQCWSWSTASCNYCRSMSSYNDTCNDKVSACAGDCYADPTPD